MHQSSQLDIETWLEDFATELMEAAGLELQVTELAFDEARETVALQLDGPDKSLAVGRDGLLIDALQTVVLAAAANAGLGAGWRRIVIDVDGFRARRDQRLCEEARRLAEDVRSSGQPRELEPMPPRERRLVHMAVADLEGVATESAGLGPERFVRLVPAGPVE